MQFSRGGGEGEEGPGSMVRAGDYWACDKAPFEVESHVESILHDSKEETQALGLGSEGGCEDGWICRVLKGKGLLGALVDRLNKEDNEEGMS